MMKRLLLSCIGFCAMFMANALTPDSAQMAIDTFVLHPDMQHASMTIAVADIKTGKIIASHNPDLSCITASTMKTVTSATALELLGGDYRFKTRVYAQGEIKGNRLKGNLLILGCGDPTLGSVYFPKNANIVQEILLALQERGIKKIDGRIIVDQSIIPYPAYNGWWDVGDLAWDYGMGIHGLSYSDNRTHLKFNALNGKIDSVMLEPPVPGLAVINRMSSENRDNVSIGLEYATPAAVLMGSAANQRYDFTIANPLPANMLVDSLQRVLKNNKIKVKNKDVKHIAPTSTLIAEHLSEPLCDIVRSLLDRSDNMFTEGLLRAVAHETGHQATAANGAAVVDSLWKSHGIDTTPLFQYDGSGLARANKNSARFFIQMLNYVENNMPQTAKLSTLMPTASKRIGKLLPETPLATDIVLKSGSMTGVQCFVGYYPAHDPQYTFALLVNNWNGTRADMRDRMDKMLIGIFGK